MPADHQSNPIDEGVLDWLDSLDGYSLNLGAGATRRRPARCVEVEYSIFSNTTAVADAHNLPFKDDTFEAIVSYNTFEHLADPAAAAKELYRVLQPGGKLRLQTAFLQPLHEEPAHFYNATEFGVRRWFADFDIDDCFVPDEMSAAYSVAWLANHALWHVHRQEGHEVREMLSQISLGQWARYWEDSTNRHGFLQAVFQILPLSIQAHFSAGFEVRARKPQPGSRSSHKDLGETTSGSVR
jgi:SAM-dependent methyltransferase